MITPDLVPLLTNMPAAMLTMGIKENYPEDTFVTARFKGINVDGAFCYECTYKDDTGDLQACQVYVMYNHELDKVMVDY